MSRAKFKKKIKKLAAKKAALKKRAPVKNRSAKRGSVSAKKTVRTAKKPAKVFKKKIVRTVKVLKKAPRRKQAKIAKQTWAKIFSYNAPAAKETEPETPVNETAPVAAVAQPDQIMPRTDVFVAPVTPFIPRKLLIKKIETPPVKIAAIKLGAKPTSEHVVDLRVRPNAAQNAKRNVHGANIFPETRAISSRRAQFSWEHSHPVALAKCTVALIGHTVRGLGKLVAAPVTLGLHLAEKIDFDRKNELVTAPVETRPKAKASVAEVTPITETESPSPRAKTPARPFALHRALLSFAGVSLAVVLPLEGMNLYRSLDNVKNKAEDAGTKSLMIATNAGNGNFPDPASIETARTAFAAAGAAVAKVGFWQNAFVELLPVIGEKYRSGKELVAAGENLLAAAAALHDFTDALAVQSDDVTLKIAGLDKAAALTEPYLDAAVTELLNVKSVPSQFSKDDFEQNLSLLVSADASLKSFLDLAPSLYTLLGRDTAKRYLVIFQNNAEIRPTGGFMGSFALVDVDRGRITKIEVPAGGPYDLQGSLRANVLAPDPLRLVNVRWQFQDANWFPDFPTSAKKIISFYNKAGGPSVDGVIALNAPVLAKLVDAVGPINMPEYGKVVVADTVIKTTQAIVESDAARESGKPKQFIADLLPKVLDKIMTGDRATMLRAVSIFGDSLDNKDIQLYLKDAAIEKKMSVLGWTGEISALAPATDSFELVRANIAGEKTDAVIATAIDHRSNISDDGTITDTVTITLKHNGVKNEPMTGVRNVEYLRAYVPAGSTLIASAGDIRPPDYKLFEVADAGTVPDQMLADVTGPVVHDQGTGVSVNNEFGRTVFGAWTQTDPAAASTITFTYNLPWKATPVESTKPLSAKLLLTAAPTAAYVHTTLFTKQPGAENTTVSATLSLPLSWYPLFAEPTGIASSNGYQTSFALTDDKRLTLTAAAQ